jgi:RNA polymerase sigma-70 factor, ECF subfamily
VRILNAEKQTMTRRTAACASPIRPHDRSSNSAELELIDRILSGETELFHELVRPSRRMVFAACFSILRNSDDAEDAAQETMLKALKNLDRFRGESKFSTWLVAIALNEARAQLRDSRVSSVDLLEYINREDELRRNRAVVARDEHATPVELLEQKELHRALRVALSSLPKAYRKVLLLRKAEDLTTAKTAGVLGLNEGVVKIRLLRARQMMRQRISAQLETRVMRGSVSRQTIAR